MSATKTQHTRRKQNACIHCGKEHDRWYSWYCLPCYGLKERAYAKCRMEQELGAKLSHKDIMARVQDELSKHGVRSRFIGLAYPELVPDAPVDS